MPISKKIKEYIERASWIRRMFEEGTRLKAEHGEENVFDFSLGNPTLEPPPAFTEALRRAVDDPAPGSHRYMANTGYASVRSKIAAHLTGSHGVTLDENNVLMTVGAAGALNCTLKAILDPGDEVIIWAPYFPEYPFYIDNHGGHLVTAETTTDFDLDPEDLERHITTRTRAVIINSPNNPTGRVYTAERLAQIGAILAKAEAAQGRPVYLLSDEPYKKIAYDLKPASLFAAHPNSVICTSHSKDLGLPGERIGFAAINPACQGASALFDAMAFTNRILGYVNAPALMQRVIGDLQDVFIDPKIYQRKRDLFIKGLREAGYQMIKPQGTFYLFPKSPIPDDVEFVKILSNHLVLSVPGVGFARAGHFRISFCCDDTTIKSALPRFAAAYKEARAL